MVDGSRVQGVEGSREFRGFRGTGSRESRGLANLGVWGVLGSRESMGLGRESRGLVPRKSRDPGGLAV